MDAPGDAVAVRTAVVHARARWAGAVLLGLALAHTLVTLTLALVGDGRWTDPLLALLATLLGLSAFGVHSDTALALLRDHRWHPDIPLALVREMDGEFLLRRPALSELRATPRIAWATTAAAAVVLAGAVLRAAW